MSTEIALEIALDNMRLPMLAVHQLVQKILLDHNAQHYSDNGYHFGQEENNYYGNYDLHKEAGETVRDEVIKKNAKNAYGLNIDDEITLTASIFSALLGCVDWRVIGGHYVQSARERYGYRWQH